MISEGFKWQMVYSNFKELAAAKTDSKIQCAASCILVTEGHHCTTFKREAVDEVCHCGFLSPFVTGPVMWENMYVKLHCKASNISGDHRLYTKEIKCNILYQLLDQISLVPGNL